MQLTKRKQEFLIYSFLGWVLENSYHKWMTGKFFKPNFLYGPLKPMYGFGGVLLVESFQHNPKRFGIAAFFIPILVEWCTGQWLAQRYQLKYWDYSNEKLQIGGCICLKFAIYWVLLAQIVVYMIQPILDRWLAWIGRISLWKTMFCGFLLDSAATLYRREKLIEH